MPAESLVQIQNRSGEPARYLPFTSRIGHHVFVVDGSQVYDVEPGTPESDLPFDRLFRVAALPSPPPLHSLSLNLAQACNLGCSYCYAGGGSFGKAESRMDTQTAYRSVDLLLEQAEPGRAVLVGFMGGEPLLHRALLHATAHYAAERAAILGIPVRFSLTTNGTLLNEDDARLFGELECTVQISLDGRRELHDKQRPSKNGRSAYDAIMRALDLFARVGRPRTLSARSTITAEWDSLPAELDHLLSLGFDDAGFAPVLASVTPGLALAGQSLRRFLAEMIECGEVAIGHWRQSEAYPFSNLHTAMEEIHKGSQRPYPCGAGAGYLSVGAQGDLFACHRFVNDDRYQMGSLDKGPDEQARMRFLAASHVDRQEPCSTCWARYLCGGGCHHEVIHAGRPACDYIRGWLTYCLQAYVELHQHRFFAGAES